MRIGFVSDTHSNMPAYTKVLECMDKEGVDVKVHLGDIIGYGPSPNECVELTLSNFNYVIRGNHEEACINEKEAWGFNPLARSAITWTARNISEENKEILGNLEYMHTLDNLLFIHGSPSDAFDYITNTYEASQAFAYSPIEFDVAFIGHTHVPGAFLKSTGLAKEIRPKQSTGETSVFKYVIPTNTKAIVNVGSVGQPRDNDPRASYAIYDTETREVSFYKVTYDIESTIAKMQRFGFDSRSYMRLTQGR